MIPFFALFLCFFCLIVIQTFGHMSLLFCLCVFCDSFLYSISLLYFFASCYFVCVCFVIPLSDCDSDFWSHVLVVLFVCVL